MRSGWVGAGRVTKECVCFERRKSKVGKWGFREVSVRDWDRKSIGWKKTGGR
jgi:hypothetical protein